jgi:hypothetical protein
VPFQFNNFQGIEGTISVPGLNAVAGIIGRWTLRREENGPNAGLYSLHAALSYSNEALLRDADFRKEVSLLLRRDRATGKQEFVVLGDVRELKYYDNQVDLTGATVNVVQK